MSNLVHSVRREKKLTSLAKSILCHIGKYVGRGSTLPEKQQNHTNEVVKLPVRDELQKNTDHQISSDEAGDEVTTQATEAGQRGVDEENMVKQLELSLDLTHHATEPLKQRPRSELLTSHTENGGYPAGTPIAKLHLSSRSYNALTRRGITHVEQLATLSDRDLLKIKNLGAKSLREIRRKVGLNPSPISTESLTQSERQSGSLIDTSLLAQVNQQHPPLDKIGVNVLDLSVRASNALRNGKIYTLEQLINCPSGLADISDLGKITEDEIVGELNRYLMAMVSKDDWQSQVIDISVYVQQLLELTSRVCSKFENNGILENIALPNTIKKNIESLTDKSVETLKDLQQLHSSDYFKGDLILSVDRGTSVLDTVSIVVNYLNEIQDYGCVDDEIDALFRGIDDRAKYILRHRLGIEKHNTLEEIATKYGITRERVRQIEEKSRKRLLSRIKRLHLFCSISAIVLLHRIAECSDLKSWKQELVNRNLLHDESYADALLAIARNSHSTKLALSEELVEVLKTGLSPHVSSAKRAIIPRIRKLSRMSGAVSSASLVNDELSEEDINEILGSEGFQQICPGWWFRGDLDCAALRVARKVISFCGPLSPQVMRHGLRKYLVNRFKMPTPPSDVIARMLESTGEFTLRNGLLQFSPNMPVQKPRLTGPEQVFINAMNSHGPILSFQRVHSELLKEGYSSASVASVLGVSPLVRKVAVGLYTLHGTQCDAIDVERAKSEVTKVRPKYRKRLHSSGVAEFQMNVGNWLSYGGVLLAGPMSSMKGDWEITSEKGSQGKIIVGESFIYGLSKAAKSLGIVPGDRIQISFNTWTRNARIEKVGNYE